MLSCSSVSAGNTFLGKDKGILINGKKRKTESLILIT